MISYLLAFDFRTFALSQSMVYADVKKRIAGAVQDKQVNFFVVVFPSLFYVLQVFLNYLRYKATLLLSSHYVFSLLSRP